MESLCRLCGKEEGIRINIFEPDADHVRKIHKILPITVNEHDPFPKMMCHRCSFKVNDFFEFRTNTIKAQELFKSNIPWLKDKQVPMFNSAHPPMVQLPISTFNTISPSERQLSNGHGANGSTSPICIDDDSPPPSYEGDSEASYTILNGHAGDNILRIQKKAKKKRSIWDSKQRRKRKKQLAGCKITEVFTTSVSEYQSIGSDKDEPENDPLSFSPVRNESSDSHVEEPRETKTETDTTKPSLNSDMAQDDITLSKYILVTDIPRVGPVYTCEQCGLTFMAREPASRHRCQTLDNDDTRHRSAEIEEQPNMNVYTCEECNRSFTRHSQLVAHVNTHYRVEYSSDDSPTPVKRRRKTKKKTKPRLLNTNNNDERPPEQPESQLMRHLILSSDSE